MKSTARTRRVTAATLFTVGVLAIGGISGAAYAADSVTDPTPDAESARIDALLAPTQNDGLLATLTALSSVGVDEASTLYRGMFATEFDDSGNRLIVRYSPTHPAAGQFVEAVRSAQSNSPLALELVELDVDLTQLHAVAAELTRPDSAIAARLGIAPTIAVVDEVSGTVVVEIDSDGAGQRNAGYPSEFVVDDVIVEVRSGGAEMEYQVSRNADLAPWSGGIALDNGTAHVTMSFTWQRWSDGELMGATAEHAYQLTGLSSWYNSYLVGTRTFYNVAADVTLLRSSPKSQFNHNMYIGTSTTSTRRDVVTALNTLPNGTQIALNGRFGLRAATPVYAQGAYTSLGGPYVLVTNGACDAGDSGGPWIGTVSAGGNIIATGQHVGRATYAGALRCIVAPLGPMSTALAASIYTG